MASWWCYYYIESELVNLHEIAIEHGEIVCSQLHTTLDENIVLKDKRCLTFCWYMCRLGYYLRYLTTPFYRHLKTVYETQGKSVSVHSINNGVIGALQEGCKQ